MNLSLLPNTLTLTRIILTFPIVFLLLKQSFLLAFILFLIAGITDGLDGFIAKKFKYQTQLGSILDPLADKLLLVSSFLALFIVGLIPWWLLITIVIRDIIIIAGTVGFYYAGGLKQKRLLTPSNLSKLNTVLQISLVALLMISQVFLPLKDMLDVGYIIVGTSTVLSGIDYTWLWIKTILLEK